MSYEKCGLLGQLQALDPAEAQLTCLMLSF